MKGKSYTIGTQLSFPGGIKIIYLDNAATTRVDPKVVEVMLPFFTEKYAVASSQFSHSPGIEVKDAMEEARAVIAKSIGAGEEEIIFTSGEAESNNWAVKGIMRASKNKKIVISRIEHRLVLNSCRALEKEGFSTENVGVDGEGLLNLGVLENSIDKNTSMVSVQLANEEMGAIQDLKEVGKLCKEKGVLFHTDASQGYMKTPLDVDKFNLDLCTISSHLIHGPKGVGALYVRNGTKINKLLDGGFNEFNLRAGIENVPGIVGFGKAVELADKKNNDYTEGLRDYLIDGIMKEIPHVLLNGPKGKKRLCSNVNVSYEYAEGESILLHLDMAGIAVVTGSACFSRSLEPSYILKAMGLTHELAHGSIRYSLSKYNKKEEMDTVIRDSKRIVENLRKISPLGKK